MLRYDGKLKLSRFTFGLDNHLMLHTKSFKYVLLKLKATCSCHLFHPLLQLTHEFNVHTFLDNCHINQATKGKIVILYFKQQYFTFFKPQHQRPSFKLGNFLEFADLHFQCPQSKPLGHRSYKKYDTKYNTIISGFQMEVLPTVYYFSEVR